MKKMTKRDFHDLYSYLENDFHFEVEEYPTAIYSKFNQLIELRNGEKWVKSIKLLSPLGSANNIKFPQKLHPHPLIEYAARHFLLQSLRTKMLTGGIVKFCTSLKKINVRPDSQKMYESIKTWIENEISIFQASKDSDTITLIIGFIYFCIENEIPEFDETLEYAIKSKSSGNSKSSPIAALINSKKSPYTQLELQEISNHLLTSANLTTKEKVMIYLCRDFGVRPIQLAMLREEDFIQDTPSPYLVFHGAKGFRKSRLRRHPNNTFQRFVSAELAICLIELIESNKNFHKKINNWLSKNAHRFDKKIKELPKPLFPREFDYEKMTPFLEHPSLTEFAPHKSSYTISAQIAQLTEKFAIPHHLNPSTFLEIGSYRFRRTVAVTMVCQGYSAEEVAEALDHSSVSSVEFYFRWNRDLIDYVNNAYNSSPQLSASAKYWMEGFFEGEKSLVPKNQEIKLNSISSLGLCANQDPCEFHPTVSCYGCSSFKPYKDGAHMAALENITNLRNTVKNNSTGAVKAQYDVAYETVIKIVEAQKLLVS